MLHRKTCLQLLLIALILAFHCTQAHAENLLINGSFETPVLEPDPYGRATLRLQPGSPALHGWSIDGAGDIDLILPATNFFPAFDQRQYVGFMSSVVGRTQSLSQVIQTHPREIYEVAFTIGNSRTTGARWVAAEVKSDNETLLGSMQSVCPLTSAWSDPAVFRFTSVSDRSTIRLWTTNGRPNLELVLDCVSVRRLTPRLAIELHDMSNIRLSWDSLINRTYQLQQRTNLAHAWVNLGLALEGTGSIMSHVQPLLGNATFYRINSSP